MRKLSRTTTCRLLAASLLAATIVSSGSARPTPTVEQYRAQVAAYRKAAASSDRTAADSARRQLAALRQVRRADGSTVTLDADVFPSSGTAENAAARARLLDTLLEPLQSGPNRPDASATARDILAQPEFADASKKAKDESWVARTLRKAKEAIRDFLHKLFGNGPGVPQGDASGIGAFLTVLLRFLLFMAAAVAVVWGGLYVARWVSFRRVKTARSVMASGLDLDDDISDPLARAKEMASQGEMRQALRLAYIASLRRLAGSGLLVLQESRTNWEYQSALRVRSQEAYSALLPATRVFDLVWYGRREATQEEFARVLAIHDALPEPQVTVSGKASHVAATSAEPAKKDGSNAW